MANYYVILGLASDASQKQIKSAYKQLVKELHPDHYGEDSAPFLEIQEAYGVLGDPKRKRAYDEELRQKHPSSGIIEDQPRSESRRSPIEPIEPLDRPSFKEVFLTRSFETFTPSFEEIFERLRRNFFEGSRPKGERIESLRVDIPLTAEQARHGGQVRVMIPVHVHCPTCRGYGGIGFFDCWRCGGQGVIDEEVPVRVPYPAGISPHHVVQIPLARFGIDNFYLTVQFKAGR